MRKSVLLMLLLLLLLAPCAQAQQFGLGSTPDTALLRAWDIDVVPSGAGLPAGSSSVAAGKQVYAEKCAACHGANGEGAAPGQLLADRLVGGQGTLASDRPIRTIGSFWPYASTLFDYIRRAMPFNAPQSLTDEEVYAVTGYLLHLNGIVDGDAVLDARTLASIRMPNAAGFVGDPRPDVGAAR